MDKNPLRRLDTDDALRQQLRPFCRLRPGEVWQDPVHGHRVGCLDAADGAQVAQLVGDRRAQAAIHDPPYNLVAFAERPLAAYIDWCAQWVQHTWDVLAADSALYVWMGADQRNQFQPLPDFMLMMRGTPFQARSFITMRNQRGYGTQKNWMAVRQELLYYTKGDPSFTVQYTDIPKILRGYYKDVNGRRTENLDRSKSNTLRASNVWVDVQQVFYRMQENVSGCYAQKPLQAIERIVQASSQPGAWVFDFFSHAGATLLAAERLGRRCCTMDIDPIYCEITIRRLLHWRETGKTGWQHSHPFVDELSSDPNPEQKDPPA